MPNLIEIGSVVLEKKIFKFCQMYFHYFVIISEVWLKLAQWFCRRFFEFVHALSQFRNYLPFEKGGALYLNKLESLLLKDALCQVWLKLAQWFWRRRPLVGKQKLHKFFKKL